VSRVDAEARAEGLVGSTRGSDHGRRRPTPWSGDEKARAIEASLAPGTVVSAVAHEHGVTPQQLFTWRRNARRKAMERALAAPMLASILSA